MDEVLADSLSRPRFVTLLLVVFAACGAAAGCCRHLRRDVVLGRGANERDRDSHGSRRGHGDASSRWCSSRDWGSRASASALGSCWPWLYRDYVASFLYGVEATDPATFVTVPVVLLGVSLMACVVPAYRAVRVEPVSALRCE